MTDANSKHSKGLRATGVAGVCCARHEYFLALGDLQKGERYANMDYLCFKSLQGTKVQHVVISYDIACQWSINFYDRMSHLLEELRLRPDIKVDFIVPKFHLPAHGRKCHSIFSFNYHPGVARTDGESVERLWAWLNSIARSASMMGPGGRWDTLDDFTNFSNWRKTTNMGELVIRSSSPHCN